MGFAPSYAMIIINIPRPPQFTGSSTSWTCRSRCRTPRPARIPSPRSAVRSSPGWLRIITRRFRFFTPTPRRREVCGPGIPYCGLWAVAGVCASFCAVAPLLPARIRGRCTALARPEKKKKKNLKFDTYVVDIKIAPCEKLPLNKRDKKKGNAALHLALEMVTKRFDITLLVDVLLLFGADPNLANDAGETPLHVLCKRDNVEYQDDDQLVKIFFEKCDKHRRRVRLDLRDGRGHTALEYAAANLLPNAVEVLLRRGADLAGFRFPSVAQFNEFIWQHYQDFHVRTACGILKVVERLEKAGYEMTRSDATTIMKIFIGNDLYMRSDDPDRYFYLQERFASKAAGIDLRIPYRVKAVEMQRLFERARTRPQRPTMSDGVPAWMNQVDFRMLNNGPITAEDFELLTRLVEMSIARETAGRRITVIVDRDQEAEVARTRRRQAEHERRRRAFQERITAQRAAGAEVEVVELEIERERLAEEARFHDQSPLLRVRIWRTPQAAPAAPAAALEAQRQYVRLLRAGELRVERTFRDLCLARPERTEELLAYEDNSRFSDPRNRYRIPLHFPRVCGVHLCEKLARGFFRRWALEPFQRLQAGGHWRLSRTCCELILKQLRNEDLWRICLAARAEGEGEE
ncbi:unnamed protein product [Trichogramma brassicae]|uniref:Uncharacterized protein n=1 Tax=Trichogramma brassicae TaxID=86971 RepID=A0A6H5IZD8_9HYME|nr:unnamed protein product [Trichogramma brassicae]